MTMFCARSCSFGRWNFEDGFTELWCVNLVFGLCVDGTGSIYGLLVDFSCFAWSEEYLRMPCGWKGTIIVSCDSEVRYVLVCGGFRCCVYCIMHVQDGSLSVFGLFLYVFDDLQRRGDRLKIQVAKRFQLLETTYNELVRCTLVRDVNEVRVNHFNSQFPVLFYEIIEVVKFERLST